MDCREFEQRVWAEPKCAEPEFARHREECPDCGKLAGQVLAFEAEIEHGIAVEAPPGLTRRIRQRQRAQFPDPRPNLFERLFGSAPVWLNAYAAVASVMLVVGLLTFSPAGDGLQPLDRLVADHYLNEAFATQVSMDVDRAKLDRLMGTFGAGMNGDLQRVSFAEPCVMENGIKGAHLVMDTEQGKVTVLILHHRQADGKQSLKIGSERGRIVPFARGTMAIIGSSDRLLDETESKIRSTVRWL